MRGVHQRAWQICELFKLRKTHIHPHSGHREGAGSPLALLEFKDVSNFPKIHWFFFSMAEPDHFNIVSVCPHKCANAYHSSKESTLCAHWSTDCSFVTVYRQAQVIKAASSKISLFIHKITHTPPPHHHHFKRAFFLLRKTSSHPSLPLKPF